jgi:aerobic-type carbon monoxide dehydrogenase small subunit (CoxS/CutS family)
MATGAKERRKVAAEKPENREAVRGPGKVPIKLEVNGAVYSVEVEPRVSLLDVLRDDLHLTGTKKVCNMGECGACTVVMEGKAVYACLLLAVECEGKKILTIEGLSVDGKPDLIQEAFIKNDAYQCGYCTPGQVMSVRALLESNPDPSQEEIHKAVSGNICRCGAYPRILAAAASAAAANKATAANKAAAAKAASEAAAITYAKNRSGKKAGR